MLPLLVYSSTAVALTWPVATNMSSLVVGGRRSDVWNSLWSLWWVEGRLASAEFPLHTDLLNHPAGGLLLVADPFNCFLGAPLVALLGPVVTYNLLVLAHLLFAALAAHALGKALGGSGWLSGFGFGLSAIVISNAHNGASEALAVGTIPLAGLLMLRALNHKGLSSQLLAAAALFLCSLAGWYGTVAAWLLLVSIILAGFPPFPRLHCLERLLPVALLAFAATAPLALATRSLAKSPEGLVEIKGKEDLTRLRRTIGPADPRIFFVPGDFRSPDFQHLEGSPGDYAHLAYLGYGLLAIALAGAVFRRTNSAPQSSTGNGRRKPHATEKLRYSRDESSILARAALPKPALWLAALLSLTLAMGPTLVKDGFPLDLAGLALPLPYMLLEKLPGFDTLSLLYRLSVLAVLSIALLADSSSTLLFKGRMPHTVLALLLIIVEARLVSPARGLPALTEVPHSLAMETLRGAQTGAVLNLPVATNNSYLYEQVIHEKPLAAGLNTGANRAAFQVLAALRHMARNDLGMDEFLDTARSTGVRYIVVHRGRLVADAFLPALRVLKNRFPILAEDDLVRVYFLW